MSDPTMPAGRTAYKVRKPNSQNLSGMTISTELRDIAEALWAEKIPATSARDIVSGVSTLDDTELACGTVVTVLGIPEYVSDVTEYSAYGITEPGWYVFARIWADSETVVTSGTIVEGPDGYIATNGANHVDVAIRFGVAALSKKVTVNWGTYSDSFVFEAPDLGIRNMDYRVTMYVYDAKDYVKWTYARTTDTSLAGTTYYTEADGVYTKAAVKAYEPVPADTYYTHAYVLTEDTEFVEGVTYYTKDGNTYTAAEVTVGDAVTANTYYIDQYTLTTDKEFTGTAYYVETDGEYEQAAVVGGEPVVVYYVDQFDLTTDETFAGTTYYLYSGGEYVKAAVCAGETIPENTYYVHSYALTNDTVFAANVTYYTKDGDTYTAAEVTEGEEVTANTYYVDQYTLTTDTEFVGTMYYTPTRNLGSYSRTEVVAGDPVPESGISYYVHSYVATTDPVVVEGVAYYTKEGNVYTEAPVTAGDPLSTVYYVHSKVTFEGLVRNVTYRYDGIIDCPSEFILPEIEDETHGCWFEIRLRHAGEYSMTLVPPSDDVKVATEHTQREQKGINMINLHYTSVGGVKLWRFLNTRSGIPA